MMIWIVLSVLFTYYFVRRAGVFRRSSRDTPVKSLQYVTGLSLGRGRNLVVVEFSGKELLIGSTENSVTLLATEPSSSGIEISTAEPLNGSSEFSFEDEDCLFEDDHLLEN